MINDILLNIEKEIIDDSKKYSTVNKYIKEDIDIESFDQFIDNLVGRGFIIKNITIDKVLLDEFIAYRGIRFDVVFRETFDGSIKICETFKWHDEDVYMYYIHDNVYGFARMYEYLDLNKEKIKTSDISCYLDDILDDLLVSDNQMIYIEEDDDPDFRIIEKSLYKDIEKFPILEKYIEFNEENGFGIIVIYGGIIMEMLFEC